MATAPGTVSRWQACRCSRQTPMVSLMSFVSTQEEHVLAGLSAGLVPQGGGAGNYLDHRTSPSLRVYEALPGEEIGWDDPTPWCLLS